MVKIKEDNGEDKLRALLMQHLAGQLPQDGLWRLDEPKLWYATIEQSKLYGQVDRDSHYTRIADEETALIAKNIEDILRGLNNRFALIDIGSGDGRKSAVILEAAKERGHGVVYVPVDVNEHSLKLACQAASPHAAVSPFKADFETLTLPQIGREQNVVLMLGNIRQNFNPSRVDNYISRNIRPQDAFIFNVQLRDKNLEETLQRYNDTAIWNWLGHMARVLGFHENMLKQRLRYNPKIGAVEFSYDVFGVPPSLERIGMQTGAVIVMANSYKPSRGELLSQLAEHFTVTLYSQPNKSQMLVATRRKQIG